LSSRLGLELLHLTDDGVLLALLVLLDLVFRQVRVDGSGSRDDTRPLSASLLLAWQLSPSLLARDIRGIQLPSVWTLKDLGVRIHAWRHDARVGTIIVLLHDALRRRRKQLGFGLVQLLSHGFIVAYRIV